LQPAFVIGIDEQRPHAHNVFRPSSPTWANLIDRDKNARSSLVKSDQIWCYLIKRAA